MSDNLQSLISDFRGILAKKAPSYVLEADKVLAKIGPNRDPKIISALALCLDDQIEHDELMFSVIHLIESWDDETYCREILEVTPILWKTSPRWMKIIHLRILNSEKTLTEFRKQFQNAPSAVKKCVRDIYEAIAISWPKLESKVREFLGTE